MKRKISIILFLAIVLVGLLFMFGGNTNKKTPVKQNENSETVVSDKNNETIKFLESISGIKAEKVEITKDPLSIKGEFIAPKQSILNGVNYFLTKTKNTKIDNLSISIENGYIKGKVDYKISENISSPIELKVIPSLDKEKNLVLNVEDVKVLDLKIYDWIVDLGLNSFIKDWFPEDSGMNVDFDKGNVIVYKDNFKNVELNKINLNSENLNIDININLKNILAENN